ncbi:MAG: Txe/YoeB family addiction module toxin [Dyadobacter sp.]|uniref:Txe/YoeB family addiction module toxin n=1 Tax=Dyadobacter sp. TaxID=1914288 RepID=UPI0032645183
MGRYSVTFSDRAKKDLSFLHKSGGKSLIKRIERIFEELGENPYSGIGKPEQLKNNLSGLWSRRIDRSIALFTRSLNKL